MKNLIQIAAAFLLLLLVGCQTAAPVPVDKYFRLTVLQSPVGTPPLLQDKLYVAPLRADGPYAERAMLFASVQQPRELQQYHYQHWSEPPSVLLQEHLRASLEAMALAPLVSDVAFGEGVNYLLNGKILRLEKLNDGSQTKAVVALRLTLHKKKPFVIMLERNYSAEELLGDGSQNAYVAATEVALQRIYSNFRADVKALN
jgi:ABC-type uncharacterized transport system auxiliary subunit